MPSKLVNNKFKFFFRCQELCCRHAAETVASDIIHDCVAPLIFPPKLTGTYKYGIDIRTFQQSRGGGIGREKNLKAILKVSRFDPRRSLRRWERKLRLIGLFGYYYVAPWHQTTATIAIPAASRFGASVSSVALHSLTRTRFLCMTRIEMQLI